MKKIVTIIKPFTYTQNIFVYEDGNKIDVISSSLDDLANNIFKLSEEYDINQVKLIGGSKFGKGIKSQVENAEMAKYNKNKLNIEWISS